MKQNITVSMDSSLLKQAKVLAARRKISISRLLAEDLRQQVQAARDFARARRQALALLDRKFALGGKRVTDRDSLHDRSGLR